MKSPQEKVIQSDAGFVILIVSVFISILFYSIAWACVKFWSNFSRNFFKEVLGWRQEYLLESFLSAITLTIVVGIFVFIFQKQNKLIDQFQPLENIEHFSKNVEDQYNAYIEDQPSDQKE